MGRLELAPLCRQNARPQVGTLHFALSSELPLSQLPQKAERKDLPPPPPMLFYGWRSELVQVTPKSGELQARL